MNNLSIDGPSSILCVKGFKCLWSQLVSKVARFPPYAENYGFIIRAHMRRLVGFVLFSFLFETGRTI